MDKFGIEVEVLAGNKKPSRLFRAWKENWEEAVLKKQDPVFSGLACKYGGIKWRDPDNGDQVVESPLKRCSGSEQGELKVTML